MMERPNKDYGANVRQPVSSDCVREPVAAASRGSCSPLAVNALARAWTIMTIAALSLFCPAAAYAKRKAPSPVPPVVWQGVEYRAPLDVEHMGYIQAFELPSHRKLWETKVYHVRIMPLLEEDVQWVFVSSMQVQGGRLLVRNEKGKSYWLDLKTGRIEGAMRYWLPWFLAGAFLMVVALFAWTRKGRGKQFASPNGGPAELSGNSGAGGGPPSVS